jgi:septal ring factor EnvC (AmiA/AmiB activator)
MSLLPAASSTKPARPSLRGWAAMLGIAFTLGISTCPAERAHAADNRTERSSQKRAAESERAELQRKLNDIKRSINQTASAKDDATEALATSESAISEANRSLHELAEEQTRTQARLDQLALEQALLAKNVEAKQGQLAKLLRGQYVAGNEDRIKLLLSGDNPNRINRDMQYMGYVSQAQSQLIKSLRANLQTVGVNQVATRNAKEELDEIAQEQREQKAALEQEKTRRATLLNQLSSKLALQRKEAGNLQQDEQRLSGLVDKLAQLIEEQKKADAIAQEQRRQAQIAARAKAEQQERSKQQLARLKNKPPVALAKGKTPRPDAIEEEPAPVQSATHNELTPVASVQDSVFVRMRGQLRLPVHGELITKFGSKRGDGPSSKGLFIRTSDGTEVKTVASGQVIFADWLRGFGNLIIVDHGSQYMTIYGNNQAVLKRAGDAVKAGDVIASSGNSGGNAQSGLYFEMRYQGRAFDPLGWVTIR